MDTESRIRRFVPIQRLSQALQDQAIALATIETYRDGEVVYAQGASDDRVHYLLAGSIQLIWHNKTTRTLAASNMASLRALDPPGRKRYTVRCTDSVTIASLSSLRPASNPPNWRSAKSPPSDHRTG